MQERPNTPPDGGRGGQKRRVCAGLAAGHGGAAHGLPHRVGGRAAPSPGIPGDPGGGGAAGRRTPGRPGPLRPARAAARLPPGPGTGSAGRGEKWRAKRMAAAYFLISGVRYWPEGEKCPPMPSYLGTLRRRFAQEQATMAAYRTGIETTEDPCLRQLFYKLAEGAWEHACKVRELVELA